MGSHAFEIAAVGLKFASALCALAAAALLVQPLILRKGATPPSTAPAPPSAPSRPVARAAEEPTVVVTAEGTAEGTTEVTATPEAALPPAATPKASPEGTQGGGIQEERTDFQGSLLSLESRPSGATVTVDGSNQGETPITVGLECARGKSIRIEFALSGFATKTHEIPCPREAMVTVTARLKPNARGGKGKR